MPDIYSLLTLIKSQRKKFLPGMPDTTKYDSTIGGQYEWVIGGGSTSNIYSFESTTIVNFAELLKYVLGSGPGAGPLKYLYAGLNFYIGSALKDHVLGNREELTYRLTPNFKVDRFHKVKGLGPINYAIADVSDFEYCPSDLEKERDILSLTNNNTMFLCFAFLQTLNLLVGLATVEFYNHGDRIVGGSDSENSIDGIDLVEAADDKFYKLASNFSKFSGLAYGLLIVLFKTFGEKPSFAAYQLRKDKAKLQQAIDDAKTQLRNSTLAFSKQSLVLGTQLRIARIAGDFEKIANIKKQFQILMKKTDKAKNSLNQTIAMLQIWLD
jgi:hypothetical protein